MTPRGCEAHSELVASNDCIALVREQNADLEVMATTIAGSAGRGGNAPCSPVLRLPKLSLPGTSAMSKEAVPLGAYIAQQRDLAHHL